MLHLQGTGLENEGDTQRLLLEACADLPDKKSKEVLQMHEAMCFLQKIRLDRLQQGSLGSFGRKTHMLEFQAMASFIMTHPIWFLLASTQP